MSEPDPLGVELEKILERLRSYSESEHTLISHLVFLLENEEDLIRYLELVEMKKLEGYISDDGLYKNASPIKVEQYELWKRIDNHWNPNKFYTTNKMLEFVASQEEDIIKYLEMKRC